MKTIPSLLAIRGVSRLVILGLTLCVSAHAEMSAKELLDKAYGNYDKEHACWIAIDAEDGQRYCMKIDRKDEVSADTGQRLYVLAVGDAVDEAGEPLGVHALPGMVGAFVVEEHDGRAQTIASNPVIKIGAYGAAPANWKFIQLGPSDYRGWQNTSGDCHQGYCGSRYSILAPYGKTIRELAGFTASFDNAGACMDKRCQRESTSIDSKLAVDSTRTGAKVFPLLVTLTGRAGGKKLAPKTWTLPFDARKWSYVVPKDWPLKDADY